MDSECDRDPILPRSPLSECYIIECDMPKFLQSPESEHTVNPLFQAGRELQEFIEARGWRFCFIGGLAVLRWGEARLTLDIDLRLLTEPGREEEYIDALLQTFTSRFSNAKDFAVDHEILLLQASNGVAVDIYLTALPFEREIIARATSFCYSPDCSLLTCSAEDLILLKAFTPRKGDRADCEGIMMRRGQNLDLKYILSQLMAMSEQKKALEIVDKLRSLTEQS